MVRLLGWPLKVVYGNIIPSNGSVIDTNDPAVTPWARTLIFWGFYERPETRFVRKYLPANHDVVELGGSIGVVSAQIGRRLEAGRQLVCIEANPSLMRLLHQNATRNAPGVRVSVRNCAVAYSDEPSEFVELMCGKSNLSGRVARPGTRDTCRVPATTLTQLLSDHGINSCSIVSDIEGAEAGLLMSDSQALAGCQLLIIELHESEVKGRRVSIADLVRILTVDLEFNQIDQRHNVYVFVRSRRQREAIKPELARNSTEPAA
jgi:FkbM family methyltransferase